MSVALRSPFPAFLSFPPTQRSLPKERPHPGVRVRTPGVTPHPGVSSWHSLVWSVRLWVILWVVAGGTEVFPRRPGAPSS